MPRLQTKAPCWRSRILVMILAIAGCRAPAPADSDGSTGGSEGGHDSGVNAGDESDSGQTPDPTCPDPLVACDGDCVNASDDPLHCGGCNPCADGEVCVEGGCEPSPDCSVEPCPGLSYCDLATSICKPGCAFDSQCGDHEVCELASHSCVCDGGFHDCGVCVADDDASQCGASCMQCPADANGEAICSAGACAVACAAGFHECAGTCVSDASADHCGGRCSPCASDPNGTAVCESGTCGIECDAGHTMCAGACAACPTGATATTCNAGQCTATACGQGFVLVGNDCIPGCATGAACGEDEVCLDLDCTAIAGTGYCKRDAHCGAAEACDFETHQCVSAEADAQICGDVCPYDCGEAYGLGCINTACIERGEDDACRLDDDGMCGGGYVCSPQTLTCQSAYCGFGCAPGFQCAEEPSCGQINGPTLGVHTCNTGLPCANDVDCDNASGVCEGGACTHAHACANSADCFSSDYVCAGSTCTPYYDAPCDTDGDCDQAGLFCVEEVGRCGRA